MDEDQAEAAREVAENTAPGTDIGAPVVATDADNDILTYTLERHWRWTFPSTSTGPRAS